MTAVGRSRLNKNEIWWRKAMGTFKDGCLEPTRLLHDDVPAKDMQVQKAMQKYRNAVQNAQLREGPNAYLKFWAPGQLIFLRPLKVRKSRLWVTVYTSPLSRSLSWLMPTCWQVIVYCLCNCNARIIFMCGFMTYPTRTTGG
uniref:Uncharacterized protein n=1 Tax=Tetraselmis chuii TaxID=63592 RepID=A0A7S1T3X7_9CHLO